MNEPVEVQVTPSNSTAETVKQMVYPVDKKRKAELLAYLIGSQKLASGARLYQNQAG